jgi:hypothetical protein
MRVRVISARIIKHEQLKKQTQMSDVVKGGKRG